MASQVRLLNLANLDDGKEENIIVHLENWRDSRQNAHRQSPQVVAWSDPDDLLTWRAPDSVGTSSDVMITKLPARNSPRWFGLLENPINAHVNYADNARVLRGISQVLLGPNRE
jgi:hypothetical protein